MNNNGVGFSFGRADAVSMVNCGAFLKWASIYIQDGTGGASYGWSVNHNADACIYGVVAYSTNDPGWQFTNMQVLPTQGSGVQAVAPVYLPSGGTNQQPVITWTAGTNGGFPSYWTYPNGLVNRGSLKVRGVNNIADTGLLPLAGGTLTGVLTLNAGTADPPLRTQTGSQIWASGVRSADGYYTIRDQSGSLTVLTVVPSGGGGVVQVATPMALSNGANFGAQTGASNTDLSKHLALHTAGYGLSVTANRLNYTAAGAAAHVFLSNGADVMAVSNTAASVVVPFQFVSKVGFNNTVPITKPTGWGAPTGTATRTTFATSTVLLPALAEHVKALIDDLTAYGLIGP
jgi:hypothetical protein